MTVLLKDRIQQTFSMRSEIVR